MRVIVNKTNDFCFTELINLGQAKLYLNNVQVYKRNKKIKYGGVHAPRGEFNSESLVYIYDVPDPTYRHWFVAQWGPRLLPIPILLGATTHYIPTLHKGAPVNRRRSLRPSHPPTNPQSIHLTLNLRTVRKPGEVRYVYRQAFECSWCGRSRAPHELLKTEKSCCRERRLR